MNAKLLQTFRAMQLALKGGAIVRCENKKIEHNGKTSTLLVIDGIDRITIGDDIDIVEISLDRDVVVINIEGTDVERYLPIYNLADEVVEELVDTMMAKALDNADRDVMVNIATKEVTDWRV